ncbi:hypothetical protein, partial [Pseudofrankia sp. BMG5.36]
RPVAEGSEGDTAQSGWQAGRRPVAEGSEGDTAGGLPFTLDRVGDCLSPRRAHAAVVEGQRAAVALA